MAFGCSFWKKWDYRLMCAIHLRHPFLLYLIYQYIACRLVGVLKSSHLQNMGNHKKWFVLYPCCLTLPGWVVLQSISSSMVLWCLDCGPSANSKHPRRLKSNTKHKTTGSSKNSKFQPPTQFPARKSKNEKCSHWNSKTLVLYNHHQLWGFLCYLETSAWRSFAIEWRAVILTAASADTQGL